jgi:hypothetical protein
MLSYVPNEIRYRCKKRQVSFTISAVEHLEECLNSNPEHEYVHGKFCQFFDAFVQGATKHLPDAKFCMNIVSTSNYQVVVYCANDYVEMGRLSTTYHKGELQYHVRSQYITNNRYCVHNSPEQHFTLSTKNLQKAIANARKYLRPNRMADIAKCTHDAVEAKIQNERGKRQDERFYRAVDAGFSVERGASTLPAVAYKVLEMYQMGLMQVEAKLGRELDVLQRALDAYKELHPRDEEFMTCVWIKPDEVQLHAFDVHYTHSNAGTRLGKGQAVYDHSFGRHPMVVPHNKLPEDVQGKVSVLSILDVGEFMYDVGIKISDSVYYIRSDWDWADIKYTYQ